MSVVVGTKLYSVPEAAKIIGVEAQTLRNWAKRCSISRGSSMARASLRLQ